MQPANVSAVIVTRGDVDLRPVLATLPFENVIVWDNSVTNLKVYGRYAGICLAVKEVIYVQDDDCVVPTETILELLKRYEPRAVTCNMTEAHQLMYATTGIALVGWGAVFDRFLPDPAFARYLERYPKDDLFLRECDRVFTGLSRKNIVTLPFEHLPHAHSRTKMGYDSHHASDFQEMLVRIAQC